MGDVFIVFGYMVSLWGRIYAQRGMEKYYNEYLGLDRQVSGWTWTLGILYQYYQRIICNWGEYYYDIHNNIFLIKPITKLRRVRRRSSPANCGDKQDNFREYCAASP